MRDSASNDFAEMEEFLELFGKRFGAPDREPFFQLFLDDATTIGTRADEVSFEMSGLRAEVASETAESDALSITLEQPHIQQAENTAFVFSPVTFAGAIDGKGFEIEARLTLGLLRQASDWKIAQLHVSVADSDEVI